jgi:putative colanic acid biosynthesis acetyltransferase WcaF
MEGGPSFSLQNRLYRFFWNIAWLLLASWTPPPLHLWRNFLLRIFGAKIHPTARIYSSAKIWYPPNLTIHKYAVIGPRAIIYCQDKITIGDKVTVSQGAHLCTGSHNIQDKNFQLITRPIEIKSYAWIAAESFIGPGVTIHEGAVIGARAVVFKDIDSWSVSIGNPCFYIKKRIFDKK